MKTTLLLKLSVLCILLSSCAGPKPSTGTNPNTANLMYDWKIVPDRTWVGPYFWANRLQDWKVEDGILKCVSEDARLRMRSVHIISTRMEDNNGSFSIKADIHKFHKGIGAESSVGFLIGAGPDLDVLGASLVQQTQGPGAGIFAGISDVGKLFLLDMEKGDTLVSDDFSNLDSKDTAPKVLKQNDIFTLHLKVDQIEGSPIKITLTGDHGDIFIEGKLDRKRLKGNIALVSNGGLDNKGRYGFSQFNLSNLAGSKLVATNTQIGPIIGSQYTLSQGVVKLTAQFAPIAKSSLHEAILEIQKGGVWEAASQATIVEPGYTAEFKITNWDASKDVPYRIKYAYQNFKGNATTAELNGTFRHDPVEKESIVVAGFTGNHMVASPGLSRLNRKFSFDSSGIWYPHTQLVKHVKAQNPDVLFFSGDQVYEGASPTFPDHKHYELDYLYKWYLFMITYRDLSKDIPMISIPDDHDVYQGNLWGGGGPLTDQDTKGGYVHPAWFVKMVERTQTSHLPDPYDPTPIEQGIGVYYTDMTYGEVGFAILEDRKFKSGCAGLPFQTRGRPDHIIDPKFDIRKADVEGTKLLGDRQLEFLDKWGQDWKGQQMKIALSQTIFANMATHHGANHFRLRADLDSNGWPQTGRNNAIDALRKAFVFHLAGDQHLASIVHHGVDDWNDGIYSFCVPSVANFYPRVWFPEAEGKNRADGAPSYLGEHIDGLGNLVTVYGVTNPTSYTKKSMGVEPKNLHDRMPGYGIVKMNKSDQTITMECWPRFSDPSIPTSSQYEGWPKTIHMTDNYSKKAVANLPEISVSGIENPVIQIVQESTQEVVYTLRIKGNTFSPKVFAEGSYTIRVGQELESASTKELEGIKTSDTETINVKLE